MSCKMYKMMYWLFEDAFPINIFFKLKVKLFWCLRLRLFISNWNPSATFSKIKCFPSPFFVIRWFSWYQYELGIKMCSEFLSLCLLHCETDQFSSQMLKCIYYCHFKWLASCNLCIVINKSGYGLLKWQMH